MYKPSLPDLKLLKGTRQWEEIIKREEIEDDEKEEEVDQKPEIVELFFGEKESDDGSKSSKVNFETHGIKAYVLGSLFQSVVEKNDYNPNTLNRHQSIIFQGDF